MKNTPNVPVNVTPNGQKEAVVVNLADVLKKAKEQTPDAIKEPTTYPVTPTDKSQESQPNAEDAPQQEAPQEKTQESQPGPAPVAPEPAAPVAPNPITALIPVRSRQEEIAYQVEKSRQLQLINTQLLSLTSKASELKTFSYTVDKDEDYRYGRLAIYDDNNREFVCKNHGVAALVVEFLKSVFTEKIDEKETELLTVSRS